MGGGRERKLKILLQTRETDMSYCRQSCGTGHRGTDFGDPTTSAFEKVFFFSFSSSFLFSLVFAGRLPAVLIFLTFLMQCFLFFFLFFSFFFFFYIALLGYWLYFLVQYPVFCGYCSCEGASFVCSLFVRFICF